MYTKMLSVLSIFFIAATAFAFSPPQVGDAEGEVKPGDSAYCTAVDDVGLNWTLANKIAHCQTHVGCDAPGTTICWWKSGFGRYCGCV